MRHTICALVTGVQTCARPICQVLISGLYVTNPDLFFDDLAVVGEVGFVHVNGVEHVASSPGIIPVDNGDKLFYDRNSYGGNLLIIPTAHNILPAWDLSMPVTFAYLEGNPAIDRKSTRLNSSH